MRIRTELSKSGLIDDQRCAAAPDPLSAMVIGLWCGEEAAQLSQRIGCDGVTVLLGPRIRQWHAPVDPPPYTALCLSRSAAEGVVPLGVGTGLDFTATLTVQGTPEDPRLLFTDVVLHGQVDMITGQHTPL